MSLKITPLAAESMGTRSMAIFVESGQFRIIIDPGISLAASRYNLPPHTLEKWRRAKHMERIRLFTESAQAIIITCFHSDHCSDELLELYKGKMIFMQNPNVGLAVNRRKSAFQLLKQIKGLPLDIIYMDNRSFEMGDLKLNFSKPFKTGIDKTGDSVISVSISQGSETFFFSSNIEGRLSQNHLKWILQNNPTFLYLDGPVTTLKSETVQTDLAQFSNALKQIFELTPIHTLLLDHHLTRDLNWRKKLDTIFELAKSRSINIQTAAEFRGETPDLFEARRQQLYRDDPPASS